MEEFAALDEPGVVEALAGKNAYRIVGVGHSDHACVAGLVADAVFSTPTAAGAHVRAQLQAKDAQRRSTKQSSYIETLKRKLDEVQQQSSLEQRSPPRTQTPSRSFGWKILLLAVLAGIVLGAVLF